MWAKFSNNTLLILILMKFIFKSISKTFMQKFFYSEKLKMYFIQEKIK